MDHAANEMFSNREMNAVLAITRIVPLTTSRDKYPALGVVTDWDIDGNIFNVLEFPMNFSHPN